MTLIEVLIAMFLFLIVSLAVLKTSTLTVDYNLRNALRDEAVDIGENRIAQLRNLPFTDTGLNATVDADDGSVTRRFRDVDKDFTRTLNITNRGDNDKEVNIRVTWDYRGQSFSHTVSTIIRRVQ